MNFPVPFGPPLTAEHFNPGTYRGGRGVDATLLSHEDFEEFWKEDLLYEAETFSTCPFFYGEKFHMSTQLCVYGFTLPWKTPNNMRV